MPHPLPPLSLYVHLPWCVRKCPYCDFNSHTAPSTPAFAEYTDALLVDIVAASQLAQDRDLISVFLGGGTPSLFTPSQIGRLLQAVRDNFRLAGDAEITMEANPGTVECGDPAGYRHAGVNRLSIGAQSFNARSLEKLGRIHNVDDIVAAAAGARAAGFDNFNIDLMYGLPGQDAFAAIADIEQAADLEPTHISWYQLTLEPNTVFHARPPEDLPDEDGLSEIQDQGQQRLAALGYEQYEVSAWARGGRYCRHNLNYWKFGDYLAAGAGAHGKISRPDGIFRYRQPANPLSYLKSMVDGAAKPALTRLTDAEIVFEFMLNVSRLSGGFAEGLFSEMTGRPVEILAERIAPVAERGLLESNGDDGWRPSGLGRRFLNDLQAAFLPD
jgi:oxygen-independent coproporphyrinogen-3 oxidase